MVGEAGVGKSRMLRELQRRLGCASPTPGGARGALPAYGSAVVYWALGEVLRQEFEIDDGDSAEVAWRKLTDGVEERLDGRRADGAARRQAATIARLLGIGAPQDGHRPTRRTRSGCARASSPRSAR